jgi:hypothetical protein
MVATGWCASVRLPRDHYVRLDSSDYSVHPGMIRRRVLVRADLDRVQAFCDDEPVADHERIWARHQTIPDSNHVQGGYCGANTLASPGRYLNPSWRSDRCTTMTAH